MRVPIVVEAQPYYIETTEGLGDFLVPASELSKEKFEKEKKNGFYFQGDDVERERSERKLREKAIIEHLKETARSARFEIKRLEAYETRYGIVLPNMFKFCLEAIALDQEKKEKELLELSK